MPTNVLANTTLSAISRLGPRTWSDHGAGGAASVGISPCGGEWADLDAFCEGVRTNPHARRRAPGGQCGAYSDRRRHRAEPTVLVHVLQEPTDRGNHRRGAATVDQIETVSRTR